jgi:transposase
LAEVRSLIDRFQSIVRRKATTDLDPWLRDAEPSLIASFVLGITKDLAAVLAAVTDP